MFVRNGLFGLILLALLSSTSAFAIVGGGGVDANTTSSPWAGVGSVTLSGGQGSGALIGSQYVLTAAHVVAGQSASAITFNLNVGGNLTQSIVAEAVTIHPSYTGTSPGLDGVWHDDLAIIKLSSPVASGTPYYDLFGGDITGSVMTLVGYGSGGDGINGVTTGASASVKRTGQNKADLLIADDENSAINDVFVFDFDGADSSTNVFGSNMASNLALADEAQYAGSDSGSPVFVNDGGVWKIAGVGAFIGDTTASASDVHFGAIGGGMLLAPHLAWISAQVTPVPEPQVWVSLLVGLMLVGRAARRRR
ncbi:MAG: trypsin-like serine protease [Thiobacillus sp.]